MKKQCINHPKYMYSGKESSPLGLGIAAEPLILGTIEEGRDKTNWIVTQKNGVKVWSRITRLSEMTDTDMNENNSETKKSNEEKKKEAETAKKKSPASRKKNVKKNNPEEDTISATIQDAPTPSNLDNQHIVDNNENENTTLNKKDQPKPKRAPTTYNIFMQYKLKQLAKEDSTMKPKERIAHAVKVWQSMDENTKQKIIIQAREALENGEI